MTSAQPSSNKSRTPVSPKPSVSSKPGESSDQIRKYLLDALEHLLAAGRSSHELVGFASEKFGRTIIPHLEKLQDEIREGKVKVQNLADAAKTSVFGIHVTAEQRDQMIREAAYYRAERSGFTGTTADEDWSAAQQEVDAMLAKQAGGIARAREALDSALEIAEKEFSQVKSTVTQWVESKQASRRKPS